MMKNDNWRIDTSTGTKILMYKDCSVIEDAQAELVMSLLSQPQRVVGYLTESGEFYSLPNPKLLNVSHEDLIKSIGEDGDKLYTSSPNCEAEVDARNSEPVGFTDIETIERWYRLRGTDYGVVERGYLPFSSKPVKTKLTDCTTAVWLSPPPNSEAAYIKRLEDLIKDVAEDGYLYYGNEGMTELQKRVYEIYLRVNEASKENTHG